MGLAALVILYDLGYMDDSNNDFIIYYFLFFFWKKLLVRFSVSTKLLSGFLIQIT